MTSHEQALTPAEAYEQYFGPAIFAPLAELLVAQAAPRSGERVLDVACGTGIVTRRVAPLVGPAGRVVGLDLNPAMIEVARAQPAPDGATIDWRQGDATALDLPDGAFDLVLCQQGLQFVSDRAAAVREMSRVLAADGRLVLAVWHGLERHPLYEALTDAELPHLADLGAALTRAELAAPFSLGNLDELSRLLEGAGLRNVEAVSRSIDARFATPDRFVERMEFAYAAVIPQFAEDPAAFASYLDKINRATRDIVERYRDGEWLVVPMHTHLAVARR